MGIPIQSDNLKLFLANGKGSDFFVRSMVLDEGLGIIPTARLELCSSVRGSVVEMDELKRYIGMAATVEFKHINVEGGEVPSVVSTRWMSGLVSSVEHLGVIDARNDGSEPVCGYRMTIRPSLAKLCMRRSRYQIANSTPWDVLRILLDSCCKGEYAFPRQGCSALNVTRDFSQGDETDYEFFVRVLASCGLSYHFQMNRAYSSPIAPKLHIINALPNDKQLSGIEVRDASGDNSKVTLCYKNSRQGGCIGSMMAWEMSQSDGVEGCAVSFGDAGGECLSGEAIEAGKTDKTGVIRLNHVPFDNIRSKDKVKQEVGVFLKSMRRNDSVWLGVTRRIEARVGASLVLRGFYGTSGSDIKDLVIARTRVRLESPIPSGQLGPWGSAGWRQYVSVACISTAADAATDFSALPTGRIGADEAFGGTTASGDFSNVEKAVSSSQGTGGGTRVKVDVEKDWRNAAGTADAWQPTTMLVQATVCAPNGSTGSTNNTSALRRRMASRGDETVSYEFHAKPDGTDGVMVVRYVQPVGGLGQGLFRVPRVGDRILVIRYSPSGASVGGINYLMGYLPGKDMPHVTSWKEGSANQMDAMTLRFDQTETMKTALCDGKGTADNEINEYKKLTAADRFDAAPSFRRGKKQNTFSEIGFYDDHQSSVKETDKNGHAKDGAAMQRGALANLQSTGDVQISANDRVEINARNIHLGCPGWDVWRNLCAGQKDPKTGQDKKADWQVADGKVEVDDISELIVRANRRIVFQVGASTIVIDKDGILLNASRWPWARDMPLFSSSVSVTGLTGIAASGSSIKMAGVLNASLADGAGGSFSADAGMACISGGIVREKTMTRGGALGSVGGMLAAIVPALFSTKNNDFHANDKYSTWGTLVGCVADVAVGVPETEGDCETALKIASVLRLVASILDGIVYFVKMGVGQKKWETQATADVFLSLNLACKTAAWAIAFVTVSWKNILATDNPDTGIFTSWDNMESGVGGALKGMGGNVVTAIKKAAGFAGALEGRNSTVTLKTDGIYVNTSEYNDFALKMQKGHGPLAGYDVDKSVEKKLLGDEKEKAVNRIREMVNMED